MYSTRYLMHRYQTKHPYLSPEEWELAGSVFVQEFSSTPSGLSFYFKQMLAKNVIARIAKHPSYEAALLLSLMVCSVKNVLPVQRLPWSAGRGPPSNPAVSPAGTLKVCVWTWETSPPEIKSFHWSLSSLFTGCYTTSLCIAHELSIGPLCIMVIINSIGYTLAETCASSTRSVDLTFTQN